MAGEQSNLLGAIEVESVSEAWEEDSHLYAGVDVPTFGNLKADITNYCHHSQHNGIPIV